MDTQPRRRLGPAWRDGLVAFVLAVGMSTMFLAPMHIGTTVPTARPSVGRILGATTTQPLVVTVTVQDNGQSQRLVTRPAHGSVIESLSQAATQLHQDLSYISRGTSIYLQRFLDHDNQSGSDWSIRINGTLIQDLSLITLRQGDEVTITRTP